MAAVNIFGVPEKLNGGKKMGPGGFFLVHDLVFVRPTG